MNGKKIILSAAIISIVPFSCGLAIKTNNKEIINDNTGLGFTQAFVTFSDSSTSSVISASVAGAMWVSPYVAENLPFATILPSDNLRALSGYVKTDTDSYLVQFPARV